MGSVAKRVREGIEALLFQSGKEDTVSEASIDEAVAFAQSVNAFDKPASERAKTISSAMLDFVSSSGRTSPTDSESYWTVDLSVGEREFLDTERTKELLDPITHTQRPKDGRVAAKLSCKSFGRDSAEVAASMLTSHIGNNLVIANLSDIIAGRPAEEALEALEMLTSSLSACPLEELDLSDNALGERGLRACSAVLRNQPSLRKLSLQNVGLSEEACSSLSELLTLPESLQSLRLYNNMSGNDGAKAISSIIARASCLEELRMASSRVGSDGGAALANALASATCLKKLDLSDNPLTEDAAEPLSQSLLQHPLLQEVKLSECALDADGGEAIMKTLSESAPDLEVLELGANDLSEQASEWLEDSLENMRNLRTLKLHENELGDKGVMAVLKGLKGGSGLNMKVLDLSDNELTEDGVESAVEQIFDMSDAWQDVQLAGHTVSRATLSRVHEMLSSNGHGKLAESLIAGLDIDDE